MCKLPSGPVVKNTPCNAEDVGLIPGPGTKIPHSAKQLSLQLESDVLQLIHNTVKKKKKKSDAMPKSLEFIEHKCKYKVFNLNICFSLCFTKNSMEALCCSPIRSLP